MSRGQSTSAGFDATTRAAMPDEGAAAVHLLRHGEVEGWGRREVRGHVDTPLSPDGRAQHAALAAWFTAHEPRPDLVLCSDLSRCRDLGERLAAATGAPLRLLPALREQHMGAWEGRTWQEINAELGERVNDYWADYVQAAPPGGESLAALAARVRAAITASGRLA